MPQSLFQSDKAVLLAKAESSYGVNPTPAAANLIYATDIKVKLTSDSKPRAMSGILGAQPTYNYYRKVEVTFKTELRKHSATAAGELSPLLRSCSLTETIAASDVTYTVAKQSNLEVPGTTIYYYQDGKLYVVLGCVGKVKMSCKTGEPIMLDFTFSGLYTAVSIPADTAFPSLTGAPAILDPIMFQGGTISVWGVAVKVNTLDIDFGQEVVERADPAGATGIDRFIVKDFKPTIALDPEVVDKTTLDLFTRHITAPGATDIMTYTQPYSGTNKLTMAAGFLQLKNPDIKDRDSLQVYDISADLVAKDTDEPMYLNFAFDVI